jgi:hypothetical protein
MGRRSWVGLTLLLLGIVLGASGVLLWQHFHPSAADPETRVPPSLEATIYLPLTDNQGKEFPQLDLNAAINAIVLKFGGATLGDRRRGFWRTDDQKVQSEPVQLLTVSFERGRLEEFRTAVAELGRRLGQQSVYVRFEEPRIELVAVPEGGGKKQR